MDPREETERRLDAVADLVFGNEFRREPVLDPRPQDIVGREWRCSIDSILPGEYADHDPLDPTTIGPHVDQGGAMLDRERFQHFGVEAVHNSLVYARRPDRRHGHDDQPVVSYDTVHLPEELGVIRMPNERLAGNDDVERGVAEFETRADGGHVERCARTVDCVEERREVGVAIGITDDQG